LKRIEQWKIFPQCPEDQKYKPTILEYAAELSYEKLQGKNCIGQSLRKSEARQPQSFLTFAQEGDDFSSKENNELTFG
jgi:hypothetical protein